MSPQKVSILHIHKVAGIAGSENHLITLLPRLRDCGYEPAMLVLADSKDCPGPFIERMRDAGVPATVMPMLADLDPLLLPRLVRFIRQGTYQIVHTHLFHADLYGTLAARIAGIEVVISTRHNDDAFRRLYPLRLLTRWTNRYCNHVICISQSLQRFSETIEKTPPNRLTVIHYGHNSKVVPANRKWRQQFGWGDDAPVLGIVARLTTQKGHSTLLRAMSKVVPKWSCRDAPISWEFSTIFVSLDIVLTQP
jgi:glycosyltransferase involved in cell wall biosynthesis